MRQHLASVVGYCLPIVMRAALLGGKRLLASSTLRGRERIGEIQQAKPTVNRMNVADRRYIQRLRCAAPTAENFSILLSDVFHRVGHEIGNPLTSIISLASIIQRFQPADESQSINKEKSASHFATSILGEAWKVGAIVEKLVMFLSEREVANDRISPLQIIEKVNARLKSRTNFCLDDLMIRVEADDQSEATSDSEQLIAVVFELLTNALRATAKLENSAGPVVSFNNSAQRLEFEVCNEVTSPFPDLTVISEPLERGVVNAPGVGIGLPTVARVATRLGGYLELGLWTDSSNRHFFSALLVFDKSSTLAVDKDENSGLRASNMQNELGQTGKPKISILLIEDQAPVASAIKKMLQLAFTGEEKIECACVTGEEALIILRSGQLVDAILCDFQLVTMHGNSIFQCVREERSDLLPHFAFMTGGNLPKEYETLPCLQKPFEPEELLAIVSKLLGKTLAFDR